MNHKSSIALKFPGADEPIDPQKYLTVTPGGLLEKDLTLAGIINKTIELLFFSVGLMLFGYLLYGGFKYLTSLGDDQAIAEAKGTITNALLGFVVIISAFFITKLLGSIFGITIF